MHTYPAQVECAQEGVLQADPDRHCVLPFAGKLKAQNKLQLRDADVTLKLLVCSARTQPHQNIDLHVEPGAAVQAACCGHAVLWVVSGLAVAGAPYQLCQRRVCSPGHHAHAGTAVCVLCRAVLCCAGDAFISWQLMLYCLSSPHALGDSWLSMHAILMI